MNYKITVDGRAYIVEVSEITKGSYKTVALKPASSKPLHAPKAASGSTAKPTNTTGDSTVPVPAYD